MPVRGYQIATDSRRDALIAHLRIMGEGVRCAPWPWTKSPTGPATYIRISDGKGGLVGAHRWVWEQINGPIPDGYEVCHNCPGGDLPSCVRPSHLWLGTHSQNILDSYAKG